MRHIGYLVLPIKIRAILARHVKCNHHHHHHHHHHHLQVGKAKHVVSDVRILNKGARGRSKGAREGIVLEDHPLQRLEDTVSCPSAEHIREDVAASSELLLLIQHVDLSELVMPTFVGEQSSDEMVDLALDPKLVDAASLRSLEKALVKLGLERSESEGVVEGARVGAVEVTVCMGAVEKTPQWFGGRVARAVDSTALTTSENAHTVLFIRFPSPGRGIAVGADRIERGA